MPKLIQCGIEADTDAVINAFGKNEQVEKVFWTLFVAMAGLVMARRSRVHFHIMEAFRILHIRITLLTGTQLTFGLMK